MCDLIAVRLFSTLAEYCPLRVFAHIDIYDYFHETGEH